MKYATLTEFLDQSLKMHKGNALYEVDREKEVEKVSYQDFYVKSHAIKQFLKSLGLKKGEKVAIVMSNQSRWLMCSTAIFFVGGVVVPLDIKLMPEEQFKLLVHADVKIMIIEDDIWKRWKKENISMPLSIKVVVPQMKEDCERAIQLKEMSEIHEGSIEQVKSEDLATLIYSSGTSGEPKGCMLTHQNYIEQMKSLIELFPIKKTDCYFSILPTNHAIDFMCGYLLPIQFGSSIVHQKTLRSEYMLHTMRRYRVTHIAMVPMLLKLLKENIEGKIKARHWFVQKVHLGLKRAYVGLSFGKNNRFLARMMFRTIHNAFGNIKLIFAGGAFVEAGLAKYFLDLGIPVLIGYGLTEAGTVLTVNTIKHTNLSSVGKPLPGVEISIRNKNNEGAGEIFVKSKTVMKGYYKNAEETKRVIENEWLRTGDVGFLNEQSYLFLIGRLKNMIVTQGGKNIFPEDLEKNFLNINGYEEMCVLPSSWVFAHKKLDEEIPLAIVRLKKSISQEFFLEQWSQKNRLLNDYKRVNKVLFVNLDFPKTASMKIKRSDLGAQLKGKIDFDSLKGVV